ncbi:uncharacterized protein DUF4279 [Mucilaginibacter gracilis]|uniref:Uncharacterized protein DUF4279 n=1 Tax=Mucilaginibacter gracilis TaxID=423350 RepID=A0A495J9C4_9SPHI|nr:DUF4279 domain-containing protein [Mucilaginibacter gracilis]RKR85078.1 uncharacterized protein DUF4279 [Mucilaginibacter gracilis]
MAKNKVVLDLRISGFEDIKHDELTQLIGFQPIMVFVIGDKRNPRNPNSPLIKRNSWLMGSGLDEYASFDDQMNAMLTIIESKLDIFRDLSKKYYCEFSCAIFTYADNGESTPWIHLDSRYNKLIKEVDIEFDLDLYAWPDTDEDE